jgi:hypothetical protein
VIQFLSNHHSVLLCTPTFLQEQENFASSSSLNISRCKSKSAYSFTLVKNFYSEIHLLLTSLLIK